MEQWATKEEIAAARERLESGHEGWRRPAAYAVGVDRDGRTGFGLVNEAANHLPAIVLARTLGHTSGTATYPMSAEQLRTAIEGLAPAEACTDYAHPNLHHWRDLLEEIGEKGGQLVAVFVGDITDEPVDRHDRALREALRR
ncbi:hypothetical protein [Nocardiopsis algeriensis]|uniref:Uncharacterized protein n=1 Tax=Nocardiopsis algeriensis TaxID=1478215 RepID=A0A841IYI7_9ACTN|nr:hypothetical protein [Nocardiopsis algeriensis]